MDNIQIIREDCACAETKGTVTTKRCSFLPILNKLEFIVPSESDKQVALWQSENHHTTIYSMLANPDRLAGFKIGGDYFYLKRGSKYKWKLNEKGMEVSLRDAHYIGEKCLND